MPPLKIFSLKELHMCLKPHENSFTVREQNDALRSIKDPQSLLDNLFSQLFSCVTPAAEENFTLYSKALFMLNGVHTLRFMYYHCINEMTSKHLNNFYRCFNEHDLITRWREVIANLILKILHVTLATLPIFLIIDDTLVEKVGDHFEFWDKLHDHTNKNGTNYIYGHCFVSLVIAVPVLINGSVKYIRVPLEHRLWIPKQQRVMEQDEQNKLEIASSMIEEAIALLGNDKKYIITCDAWYSKAPITNWVDREDVHVDMIAAVRVNSRIWELPEEQTSTGRRGRKPLYGKVINLEDVALMDLQGTNYNGAYIQGKAHIFGHSLSMYITQPKKGGARKLFLCTDPKRSEYLDCAALDLDPKYARFLKKRPEFVGLAAYGLRWMIETVYLEQKTWWGLCDYRLRSQAGFMTLINLNSVLYAITSMLPHLDENLASLVNLSIQERRARIGRTLDKKLILSTFVKECVTHGNSGDLATAYSTFCESYLLAV